MGFFNKKKKIIYEPESIQEIEKILAKRLDNLELEIEKIKSHIISLRGFVNRRLSGQDPATETNKSRDGLDTLRFK